MISECLITKGQVSHVLNNFVDNGQGGQVPPVYGTTPPPGYSYDQQPAEVSVQQS